jgi:type II secretory pathway pseudopilin PulG
MMGIRKNKVNSNTRTNGGFSVVELLVTGVVLTVVSTAGVMGITRARASVRLAGAAREYGAYVEKARIQSIRSHADDESERAGIVISDDKTSYTVMLDLDGDGDLDTRTIPLPDGVKFDDVEAISFDWRGRTWHTAGGNTEPNAQVSIRLVGTYETASVDITGSGDVTINSAVFDDKVPNVNLKVDDLASSSPTPTPSTSIPTATPTPVPVGTPDNTANPDPTPLPTPDIGVDPFPTPTPQTSPTPTPTATPTPTPAATPTPTPAPTVCTITADKITVILAADGSTKIKVSHDAGVELVVTGTSSNPSNLQVSPGSLTLASGVAGEFTVKAKRSLGAYTATFSTSCGSKTVPVVVGL